MPALKRVMLFIDVQNLLMACISHTPKLFYNLKDLVDLLVKLVPDRELVDVCLYSGVAEPIPSSPDDQARYDKQLGFYAKVRGEYGYRAFVKKTKMQSEVCKNCGHTWAVPKHKGIDVALATDVMLYGLTDQYDVAIIVSGDSDFATVINKMRDRRPSLRIEVAQFGWVLGNELRESASMVHLLDEHINDFCTGIENEERL